DLVLLPCNLNNHRVGGDVDNTRPEDIAQLHNFSTRLTVDGNLNKGKITSDRRLVMKVLNLDNICQFIKGFLHFPCFRLSSLNQNRHSRELRLMSWPDSKAVYIEVAASEHSSHSGENPW